ncbi:13283_t:CDS:2, partial [Dentiscutata heterogama]
QGIFRKGISQDFWKCTVAEIGKTRWRDNIACNIVERCKQFKVFLSTDEQGWQHTINVAIAQSSKGPRKSNISPSTAREIKNGQEIQALDSTKRSRFNSSANKANQCVDKKLITQDLHQVKSIVKKENKWSMLISAPWFFAPTVLEQGIEE